MVVRTIIMRKKVSCSLEVNEKLFYKGQSLMGKVVVHNKSWLTTGQERIVIEIVEGYQQEKSKVVVSGAISGNSTQRIHYTGPVQMIGAVKMQIRKARVRDLLSLFSTRCKISLGVEEVYVLPKVIANETIELHGRQNYSTER